MVQVHSSRPNSLPRIMHGKYREILALATPTAASKTTSKLLPCYCSCYYFRLIWPLPDPLKHRGFVQIEN
jgi:hypothetical protein